MAMDAGLIREASFSFTIERDGDKWYVHRDGTPTRTVLEVKELFDVTITARRAYPHAFSELMRGAHSQLPKAALRRVELAHLQHRARLAKYLCRQALKDLDGDRYRSDPGRATERRASDASRPPPKKRSPRARARGYRGRRPPVSYGARSDEIMRDIRKLGPEPDRIFAAGEHVIWKRRRDELLEELRLDVTRRVLEVHRPIQELNDPVVNAWLGYC